LWFHNVLPSLLPFMIAVNMLVLLGFADFAGFIFAPVMRRAFRLPGAAGFGLFTGITSGYPMGAKTVADLKRTGKLSVGEAQHLLAFCNNAGPLFILGVVGVGMFQSARVGYILWLTHVLAALTVGILFRSKTKISSREDEMEKYRKNRRSNMHSIGKVLGDAVKNAMESITIIGGLIIFFSVVVAVFEIIASEAPGSLQNSGFGAVFAGLVEVTNGVRKLSSLEPSLLTLSAVAFIVAFGGFSVHAQSFHFLAGTGIKNKPYLFAKFLHGLFAAFFTAVFWRLLVMH